MLVYTIALSIFISTPPLHRYPPEAVQWMQNFNLTKLLIDFKLTFGTVISSRCNAYCMYNIFAPQFVATNFIIFICIYFIYFYYQVKR